MGKAACGLSMIAAALVSRCTDQEWREALRRFPRSSLHCSGSGGTIHSYGGAIVTEAGNDSHVAALVYIAAHALDVGETEFSNGRKYPNLTRAVVKTPDGFLLLNPPDFTADFAADLPRAEAEFEAHAQMPASAAVFTAEISDRHGRRNPVGTWSPRQAES
jgi:hypothetical protein